MVPASLIPPRVIGNGIPAWPWVIVFSPFLDLAGRRQWRSWQPAVGVLPAQKVFALGRVDIEIGPALFGTDLAGIGLVLLLGSPAGRDLFGFARIAGAQILGKLRALVHSDAWKRRRRVVRDMPPAHALFGGLAAFGADAVIWLGERLGEGRVAHLVAGAGMRLHLDASHFAFTDARRTHDDIAGRRSLAGRVRTRTFGAFAQDCALNVRSGLEVLGGLRRALGLLARLLAALGFRVFRNHPLAAALLGVRLLGSLVLLVFAAFALFVVVGLGCHVKHSLC